MMASIARSLGPGDAVLGCFFTGRVMPGVVCSSNGATSPEGQGEHRDGTAMTKLWLFT